VNQKVTMVEKIILQKIWRKP